MQGKVRNTTSDIVDLIFSFLYACAELEEGFKAHYLSLPACLPVFRLLLMSYFLRSSGMLCGVDWWLVNDRFGSAYPYLIQATQLKGTLEDGTDWLSRNVGTSYQPTLRNVPEELRSRLHRGRRLKSPMPYLPLPCAKSSFFSKFCDYLPAA
jgi:hypothetical protein